MRILIVEDNLKLANFIQKGLKEQQYAADTCISGEEALQMIAAQPYDLIILDLMLPGMSGLELLEVLRSKKDQIPILVLTAKDGVEDRVKGLDVGADDYMVKPFAFAELLARVRSLSRRAEGGKPGVVKVGDIVLDPITREVKRGEAKISLSAKEYALLEYLMKNAGKVVTRTMIAENVWDRNFATFSNVIDVFVNFLRNKIDHDRDVKLIQTVRGVGYMMKEPT
jgi:DNA-binding response OmpR family regulator